jgi:hypothetical protein
MAKGRNPEATRRAGASAAPSHAPAANAHKVPSRYSICGPGTTGELRADTEVVTEFDIKSSLRLIRLH